MRERVNPFLNAQIFAFYLKFVWYDLDEGKRLQKDYRSMLVFSGLNNAIEALTGK